MIDIGIDESKSGSTLVLSAIIGKTGSMEKLDTEWTCELKRSGVDYFFKEHAAFYQISGQKSTEAGSR